MMIVIKDGLTGMTDSNRDSRECGPDVSQSGKSVNGNITSVLKHIVDWRPRP